MAGRKPLDAKAINIRLSPMAMKRTDDLVGPGRRARFIREAVDHALNFAAMLKQQRGEDE